MITHVLKTLAATGCLLASCAAADVKVVSAPLVKSPAIRWEDKDHQAIESKLIADEQSIRLEHCSDIRISMCDLRSIELIGCTNITVANCWIHDSAHVGVTAGGCGSVTVQACRIERVASGVYAVDSKQVHVIGNFVRNVIGPMPRGQLAQFDTVTGADNVIRGNYCINERGKNHSEDDINLFKCRGTPESPIIIEDNYLTGDPAHGSEGMSKSGSGIMLGDYGGSHLLCRRNVVISAGQCGIGVAGGSHIRVEDNLIFGAKSDVSNVGLYAWNQSHLPSDHVTLTHNRVYWVMPSGEENSWWNGGGISELNQRDNQFADKSLAEHLPAAPSAAPMPPGLLEASKQPGAGAVVQVPWTPEQGTTKADP